MSDPTRDTDALPAAVRRFRSRAAEHGLDPRVQEFPQGTRTAADAATAIGCEVGQIVKSLVFVAVHDDHEEPVLVLTSGANRVDEGAVARALGVSRLRKGDAGEVRDATGYAIGGTPPVGHDRHLRIVCDRALTSFAEVWAAAGTPSTVFPLTPQALLAATGAEIVDVAP